MHPPLSVNCELKYKAAASPSLHVTASTLENEVLRVCVFKAEVTVQLTLAYLTPSLLLAASSSTSEHSQVSKQWKVSYTNLSHRGNMFNVNSSMRQWTMQKPEEHQVRINQYVLSLMSHCLSDLLVLLQVQQEESSPHLQSTLQPVRVTVLKQHKAHFLHLLDGSNKQRRKLRRPFKMRHCVFYTENKPGSGQNLNDIIR